MAEQRGDLLEHTRATPRPDQITFLRQEGRESVGRLFQRHGRAERLTWNSDTFDMGLFASKCKWPSCSTTGRFAKGYCDAHKKHAPSDEEIKRNRRGWRDPFYDSARWRGCAKAYLKRFRLCSLRLEGCTRIATEVDHIVPRAKGGDDFDWKNLRGLCHSCHAKRTVSRQ